MNKDKVKQFIHLLAGLLVLIHGFHAFEKEDVTNAFFFLALAFIFLVVAGLQQWLERRVRKAGAFFCLVEGLALAYSAWRYQFDHGKYWIVLSGLAAIFYIFYAIYLFKRKRRRRRKHRSRSHNMNGGTINEL